MIPEDGLSSKLVSLILEDSFATALANIIGYHSHIFEGKVFLVEYLEEPHLVVSLRQIVNIYQFAEPSFSPRDKHNDYTFAATSGGRLFSGLQILLHR